MTEEILYFIWETKNFDFKKLSTIEGKEIQILKFGYRNSYSGPDFSNGQILIDGLVWYGAIEFHIKTSDWNLHQHQKDENYNQVIIHVVWEHDKVVNSIPVLELKNYVKQDKIEEIKFYLSNFKELPCEDKAHLIPRIYKEQIVSKALIERFGYKLDKVNEILKVNNNDWEQTTWEMLCTYFGFNINTKANQALARKINIAWISKNNHLPFAIESLIFGTAGFLDIEIDDEYQKKLKDEWNFYKNKYQIVPIESTAWKKGGMRPYMQPEFKLSQLIAIVNRQPQLFSKMIYCDSLEEIKGIFNIQPSNYWSNHFRFGQKANSNHSNILGDESINLIIINVVVPIIYAYGVFKNDLALKEKSFRILESIPKENNSITRKMNKVIGFNRDASDSQALIHQYKNYCVPKKCLDCILGQKILSN